MLRINQLEPQFYFSPNSRQIAQATGTGTIMLAADFCLKILILDVVLRGFYQALANNRQPNGAGEGNRTLVIGLEGQCFTTKLHPHLKNPKS